MGKFTTWMSELDRDWMAATKNCFKITRARYSLIYKFFAFVIAMMIWLPISIIILFTHLIKGLTLLTEHRAEKKAQV